MNTSMGGMNLTGGAVMIGVGSVTFGTTIPRRLLSLHLKRHIKPRLLQKLGDIIKR